jgi:lipopolysaccharide/colanic/teichoic acid biosynthesis glycosyltransferase
MPRVIEVLLVLLTAPLWMPVFGLLTLLIRCIDGKPVFFRQERPGLHGHPFTLVKFRTMRAGTESDDVRTTRLGAFLRATSLDELPELFHVLSGKMSLVGPRPLLMAYLEEYTEAEHHRHDVRPGITGWAQVHGRNAITRAEKVQYDLEYVAKRSFWFDCRILLMTLFHLRGN